MSLTEDPRFRIGCSKTFQAISLCYGGTISSPCLACMGLCAASHLLVYSIFCTVLPVTISDTRRLWYGYGYCVALVDTSLCNIGWLSSVIRAGLLISRRTLLLAARTARQFPLRRCSVDDLSCRSFASLICRSFLLIHSFAVDDIEANVP